MMTIQVKTQPAKNDRPVNDRIAMVCMVETVTAARDGVKGELSAVFRLVIRQSDFLEDFTLAEHRNNLHCRHVHEPGGIRLPL